MKKLRIGIVYIVSFCLVCFPILCNLEVYAAGKPQMRSSLSMKTGEQKILRVKGKQIKKIKFKSTNPKIVSVKKNGKVTAKSTGNAKIKATVTYFQNKKIRSMKLVCRVCVSEPKKEVNSIPTSAPTPTPTSVPTPEPTLTLIPTDSPTPFQIPDVDNIYDLPDSMRRDPGEVEALKKLIATQNAFGAKLDEDLDGSSYLWSSEVFDGGILHLYEIHWNNSRLYGAVDFSPFSELRYIECKQNYITDLNFRGCELLYNIDCSCNDLTSLDLSNNPKLMYLQCFENNIMELNFGDNHNLRLLYCASNQIDKLDLSKETDLTTVFCWDNNLKEIDISKNQQLLEFRCEDNPISALDISNNVNLINLSIGHTNITRMDFSNHPMLSVLECYSCKLQSLDVSVLPALSSLWCGNNGLHYLDVSKNIALKKLWCSDNEFTSLDVSHNPSLQELWCVSDVLERLDVSKNKQLTEIMYNPNKTKLIGVPPECTLRTRQ